ncbi:MAG: recombinase family protein, partial [Chloroflexi bacterium]|nr:recombinase family protein [Chloroflexota bacterium]
MKAAIYARVSTEEQLSGYSIDAQLRACREHAGANAAEYVEEGKSARTEDIRRRPVFRQLLADAEAGKIDCIIVHKLDRFSRNLRVTLEAFERLAKANVSFISISEQIDYSTPHGKLFLHMLAALAQWYSDQLSQETRKGKLERKLQGLYNGLLPFGVTKGEDGLPVRDTRPQSNGSTNYEGLLLIFGEGADRRPDAQIAKLMNEKGYRTTGNRGNNLFRKDTIRRILINHFYVGDLPDGKGGWLPGKHPVFIDKELFIRAQQAREQNRTTMPSRCVNHKSRTYSLTGLLRCWYCEQSGEPRPSTMRIQVQHGSEPRVTCYSRSQGFKCEQRSLFLSVYEEQLEQWLAQLKLPEDAVDKALAQYASEAKKIDDPGKERQQLQRKLERLREVYLWGDIEKEEYLAQRDQLAAR